MYVLEGLGTNGAGRTNFPPRPDISCLPAGTAPIYQFHPLRRLGYVLKRFLSLNLSASAAGPEGDLEMSWCPRWPDCRTISESNSQSPQLLSGPRDRHPQNGQAHSLLQDSHDADGQIFSLDSISASRAIADGYE